MRIGVIVNPVAGMGGAVGLKGTDGPEVLAAARARGARPVAGARTRRALAILAATCPGAPVLLGPGQPARECADGLDLCPVAVGPDAAGGAAATRAAARRMRDEGVGLVAFAGGDGTARDVLAAVGRSVPLLGIPCGVKMHSGVFALSPEAAGRMLADWRTADPARIRVADVEIVDADEAGLRAGRLSVRLHGHARAPRIRNLLQNPKAASGRGDEAALAALGCEIAAEMAPGATYLVGPGATAKRPLAALGIEGELRGVDVVRDRQLLCRDAGAAEARAAAGDTPLRIIVGVIGGQGFVFGRGNQQIGADAIRRCWPDRVDILADAAKLLALPQPRLLADTGDAGLDAAMEGHVRVRVGPGRMVLMRIGAGD